MTTETKATHTPGPWRLSTTGTRGGGFYDVVGGHTFIAAVETHHAPGRHGYDAPGEQARGNARLIAAAPDLLAVCEAAYAEFRDGCDCIDPDCWVEKAGAAIAKARGEAP